MGGPGTVGKSPSEGEKKGVDTAKKATVTADAKKKREVVSVGPALIVATPKPKTKAEVEAGKPAKPESGDEKEKKEKIGLKEGILKAKKQLEESGMSVKGANPTFVKGLMDAADYMAANVDKFKKILPPWLTKWFLEGENEGFSAGNIASFKDQWKKKELSDDEKAKLKKEAEGKSNSDASAMFAAAILRLSGVKTADGMQRKLSASRTKDGETYYKAENLTALHSMKTIPRNTVLVFPSKDLGKGLFVAVATGHLDEFICQPGGDSSRKVSFRLQSPNTLTGGGMDFWRTTAFIPRFHTELKAHENINLHIDDTALGKIRKTPMVVTDLEDSLNRGLNTRDLYKDAKTTKQALDLEYESYKKLVNDLGSKEENRKDLDVLKDALMKAYAKYQEVVGKIKARIGTMDWPIDEKDQTIKKEALKELDKYIASAKTKFALLKNPPTVS